MKGKNDDIFIAQHTYITLLEERITKIEKQLKKMEIKNYKLKPVRM